VDSNEHGDSTKVDEYMEVDDKSDQYKGLHIKKTKKKLNLEKLKKSSIGHFAKILKLFKWLQLHVAFICD